MLHYLNIGALGGGRWQNLALSAPRFGYGCKLSVIQDRVERGSFNLNLASHNFTHIKHDGLGNRRGNAIIPNPT
jgi:hypothetical protein